MVSNNISFDLTPKCGFCNDVRLNNNRTRKIIWLVPHVIKHKEGSEIIIWRCNWGKVCNSGCLYAIAKEQTEKGTAEQDKLSEIDLTLTIDEN